MGWRFGVKVWEGFNFQTSEPGFRLVGDDNSEQRAGMPRVLTIHVGVGCIIACALAECHCNVSLLHEVLSGFLSRETANHQTGIILTAGGAYVH